MSTLFVCSARFFSSSVTAAKNEQKVAVPLVTARHSIPYCMTDAEECQKFTEPMSKSRLHEPWLIRVVEMQFSRWLNLVHGIGV